MRIGGERLGKNLNLRLRAKFRYPELKAPAKLSLVPLVFGTYLWVGKSMCRDTIGLVLCLAFVGIIFLLQQKSR